MKKLLFLSLLFLAACGDEPEIKVHKLEITPITGPVIQEPFIDRPNGNASVCTITKTWSTGYTVNGFHDTADITFTTSFPGPVLGSIRDGEATFTVTNHNTTSVLYVWVYGFENKKKTIPAGGSVTYVWPIADCSQNPSIVKRYVFDPSGCSDLSVTFQNTAWTNGHLVGTPSGATFYLGNIC